MAPTPANDDSQAGEDHTSGDGETQLAHEGSDSQDSNDQAAAPAALAVDELFMTPLPVPLPTTPDDADADEQAAQGPATEENDESESAAEKAEDEAKEGGSDKSTKASSEGESKIDSLFLRDHMNMVVEINEDDDIIIAKPATSSATSATKKSKSSSPKSKPTTLKSPTTPGATYSRGEYNSKTKRMSETDLSFERILNKQICHCSNQKQCKLLLKQYYQDKTSPYPSGSKDHPQLIISIANPRNPNGRNKRQAKRKQQIYDRAAQLLNVSNAEKRDCIKAGIHHFPRVVIEQYATANNLLRKEKGKKLPKFIDYLLPKYLVEMRDCEDRPILGREITDGDRFNCIETCVEHKVCRKQNEGNGEGKCHCNLYMNLPFVTCDMAKESIGQKIVLLQTPEPNLMEKSDFHFEEKIEGKKHKQCRKCKVLKKSDEFSQSQWRKAAGMSECRVCGMKEVQAVSTSTREQIRVLSHDNAKWKQDHKHLQMAHHQAQSKIKQLTLQLDVARKKVKSLQKKTSRAKTSLGRKTDELKCAREQQAYYQSLPIPTDVKAMASPMKATKASKRAAADKARGTKRERYGERYELISNPKKRKNPDGSFLPIQPPKKLDDGTYKKPCGRAPKGYKWDGIIGLWMPQEEGEGLVSDRMRLQPAHPPTQAEDGTYKRPHGRQPHGHRWDGVSGMWVPEEEEEQQHNNMDEGDSSDDDEEEEDEEEGEAADDEEIYHYGVHHAGMEQAEVEVEARTSYNGYGGYNDC